MQSGLINGFECAIIIIILQPLFNASYNDYKMGNYLAKKGFFKREKGRKGRKVELSLDSFVVSSNLNNRFAFARLQFVSVPSTSRHLTAFWGTLENWFGM